MGEYHQHVYLSLPPIPSRWLDLDGTWEEGAVGGFCSVLGSRHVEGLSQVTWVTWPAVSAALPSSFITGTQGEGGGGSQVSYSYFLSSN